MELANNCACGSKPTHAPLVIANLFLHVQFPKLMEQPVDFLMPPANMTPLRIDYTLWTLTPQGLQKLQMRSLLSRILHQSHRHQVSLQHFRKEPLQFHQLIQYHQTGNHHIALEFSWTSAQAALALCLRHCWHYTKQYCRLTSYCVTRWTC